MINVNHRETELDAYDEDGAYRSVLTFEKAGVAERLAGNFLTELGVSEDLLVANLPTEIAYRVGIISAHAQGLAKVEEELTRELMALNIFEEKDEVFKRIDDEVTLECIAFGDKVVTGYVKTGFVTAEAMIHQFLGVYEEPGFVELLDERRLLVCSNAELSFRYAPAELGDFSCVTVDLHGGGVVRQGVVNGEYSSTNVTVAEQVAELQRSVGSV